MSEAVSLLPQEFAYSDQGLRPGPCDRQTQEYCPCDRRQPICRADFGKIETVARQIDCRETPAEFLTEIGSLRTVAASDVELPQKTVYSRSVGPVRRRKVRAAVIRSPEMLPDARMPAMPGRTAACRPAGEGLVWAVRAF